MSTLSIDIVTSFYKNTTPRDTYNFRLLSIYESKTLKYYKCCSFESLTNFLSYLCNLLFSSQTTVDQDGFLNWMRCPCYEICPFKMHDPQRTNKLKMRIYIGLKRFDMLLSAVSHATYRTN